MTTSTWSMTIPIILSAGNQSAFRFGKFIRSLSSSCASKRLTIAAPRPPAPRVAGNVWRIFRVGSAGNFGAQVTSERRHPACGSPASLPVLSLDQMRARCPRTADRDVGAPYDPGSLEITSPVGVMISLWSGVMCSPSIVTSSPLGSSIGK
jgi:hypothetical protein